MALRWVPIKRGDQLPAGAVFSGKTETDGEVYVARNLGGGYSGVACGKLNLKDGKMYNIWVHGSGEAKEGEILVTVPGSEVAWLPIRRGDKLPPGSVLGGSTQSDGDVYVSRDFSGACGKLNLDKGAMHNIWVHGATGSHEGDVLTVSSHRWIPIKHGEELPVGSIHAGATKTDGDVYVGRHHNGACGKLNLDKGRMNNIWVHGIDAKPEGEVLSISPFSWHPIKRGDDLPAGCILSGCTDTDGQVYVARNPSGGCGKLNLDDGKMHNIWVHGANASQEGEVLTVPGSEVSWVIIKRGDELPAGCVLAGNTSSDGDVYVARNPDGAAGKLNLSKGKMHNIWVHGAGETHEGEVLTVTTHKWVPIKRGEELPPGCVLAGQTRADGEVYVARMFGGACGKLNLDKGKMHNIWVHGNDSAHEGEVLVLSAH